MKKYTIALIAVFHLLLMDLSAQTTLLPTDSVSGEIVFTGKRSDKVRSKKKKMEGMIEWVSKPVSYPPMVFSIISSSNDTLIVKGVTEVPSIKGIHPISFKLELVSVKKGFRFRASKFYFEDIKLSLQEWLDKYATSENKRNQRNVELITKGVESHIFLSMNQLNDTFKK